MLNLTKPTFIYGTAWKEETTAELTKVAISAGFAAIDTANQKKHYREDFVGEALFDLFKQGLARETLFLQTKFTYAQGQDHRLPYNPEDSFSTQVKSSFESSLKHLHTDYIDSYLLHGPSSPHGLTNDDWEVWQTMEGLVEKGAAKQIGVSNVGLHQLKELTEKAKIKPTMVQNRCYASKGWDREVREFCLDNNIGYQGFSLLTANPQILKSSEVNTIAKRMGGTPEQVVFCFAKQIGMIPITGTTKEKHMIEDLNSLKFELSSKEVDLILGKN